MINITIMSVAGAPSLTITILILVGQVTGDMVIYCIERKEERWIREFDASQIFRVFCGQTKPEVGPNDIVEVDSATALHQFLDSYPVAETVFAICLAREESRGV